MQDVLKSILRERGSADQRHVPRLHLLEDVIENIERDGTHYGKVGLTMRMGERDGLWKRFQETKKRKATE